MKKHINVIAAQSCGNLAGELALLTWVGKIFASLPASSASSVGVGAVAEIRYALLSAPPPEAASTSPTGFASVSFSVGLLLSPETLESGETLPASRPRLARVDILLTADRAAPLERDRLMFSLRGCVFALMTAHSVTEKSTMLPA